MSEVEIGKCKEGRSVVFLFSGQGSQHFQMGKELYLSEPVFKQSLLDLDNIVKRLFGYSVISVMYDSKYTKSDKFSDIRYTHPAIVMIEFALSKLLISKGIKPDLVVGTSVGEFASAAVAGVITVEQMIEFVIRQAECILSSCGAGSVIAVLSDFSSIKAAGIDDREIELVSINFENSCVLAGSVRAIKRLRGDLSDRGIACVILPVEYAFHTSLIDPAESHYLSFLKQLTTQPAKVPMMSCVNSQAMNSVNADYFWQIARRPILFRQVITKIESGSNNYTYIDLGPSGTLATYVKYLKKSNSSSEAYSILNMFGQDVKNLNRTLEAVKPKDSYSLSRFYLKESGKNKCAYLFPGQGSQAKGMGKDLFGRYPQYVEVADSILGYSISDLCLHDPLGQLSQTQYTQPALFVVNALSFLAKLDDGLAKPSYFAGHSLGEYNALWAAGVFDFKTGLELVAKRGHLMGEAKQGGMAAVIGLSKEEVEGVLCRHSLSSLDIANINGLTQIVISGPKEDILAAGEIFESVDKLRLYHPLPVGGAFHSRYMREAGKEFEKYIGLYSFKEPEVDVISNVSSREFDSHSIQHSLVQQISSVVRWSDSIFYLMRCGVDKFEEIGPGKVLTNLVTKMVKEKDAAPMEM